MTQQEFETYFKSLGKGPGEFTNDEVYELGKLYRDVVGKHWTTLSNMVGWSNGENLRCFVKNRLAK